MISIKDCCFILILLLFAIWALYRIKLLKKEILGQKEFFINTLGHDIRVPLIAQIRGLEFLSVNIKQNTDNILISNELYSCSKYTFDLITMLMDIYKIETGEINFANDNCKISDIYSVIAAKYMSNAIEKNINIIFKTGDISLLANKEYLTKALKILIKTAITYSDKNTVIYFDTVTYKKNIVFDISYTGNPVTEEEYNRMFSKNTVYSVVGQGIQMFFCKKIIDLHKGKISFNSDKNRLNTFRVKIPNKIRLSKLIEIPKQRFWGYLSENAKEYNRALS